MSTLMRSRVCPSPLPRRSISDTWIIEPTVITAIADFDDPNLDLDAEGLGKYNVDDVDKLY